MSTPTPYDESATYSDNAGYRRAGYLQALADMKPRHDALVAILRDAQIVVHNFHCVQAELPNLHYPLCSRIRAALKAAEEEA